MRVRWLGWLLAACAPFAVAQDLSVYSDGSAGSIELDNGFQNYSYGGGSDFAQTTVVRTGTSAISFAPLGFNAVAFAHPTQVFAQAQYVGARFWIRGNGVGGQILRVNVYSDADNFADAGPLAGFIQGGAISGSEWRLAEVRFADPAIGYTGNFGRFEIFNTDGNAQATVFIDDVALISATRPDALFADGFEGDAAGSAGTLQFTPAAPDQNVGENAGTATFTVTRTGGSAGAVGTTVVLGGTATSPADYSNSALALTWASGDVTSRTVTLTIVDDGADEPNETVTLALGAPTGGATLGAPASATLTITDNDPAVSAGTLQFTPASPNQNATETSGAVTFTVSRVGGASGTVGTTVSLGGTATNPADYTNSALGLSWGDGDATNRTITITPVADLVDEPSETVTLQLGAPTGGATLGAPASATLTITDADLLFAPQYTTGTIKVYRRGPSGFALLNTATLANGTRPNAIAFAPDGKLWVANEGAANPASLLRYNRASIIAGGAVAAEVTISVVVPAAPAACCLFDLAFFGDFAYVTQSDFGAIDRILKYPLASLAASGAPVPTLLTNASFDVPAGLEFDPQGRLWVSNNAFNTPANTSVVRIDTTTGAADRSFTNVTVSGRNALIRPEGLAFDALGTLWVGNNGEQTIVAYSPAQLAGAGGAVTPVHVIEGLPGALVDGTFGGVAFDTPGALWANWQRTPFEQREYLVASGNGGTSYTSSLRQVITNATTFPGFGGIAFWPVPATVHRGASGGAAVAQLDVDTNVDVAGMMSDRYTWIDASGNPRSAALAHNDKGQGPTSVGGYPNHGGAMREYRFTMPGGATRTATVTTYGNAGQGGFGYVVSHPRLEGCGGDSSPLGYGTPGTFQRVSTGRHHAIFRFTQQYPRLCDAAGALQPAAWPVTIDWFFATGRDHPLWAITYDLSAFPVGRFNDDSRAPYGEFNIDGDGFTHDVSGIAWGDRFKFTSQAPAGVHLDSPWSYQGANTVPWVKLWIAASDATMGLVQTQTIDQHDAGGGRNRFVYDLRDYWNETSANDNDAGPGYAMPHQNFWPYQANSFSVGVGVSNNNARLTWGTQYGFLGQSSYVTNNQLPAGTDTGSAPGYPRKSYATYVVLGAHSTAPVEAQVAEIEAVQQSALTANVGTVRLSGPAGPGRVDNATYTPAGWDHVYGIWTLEIFGNAADGAADADFNLAVGAGHALRNPIFNVRNWQGTTLPASVTFNGVALVQDVDYFPSIVDDANELLITLRRTLSGATNRIVVLQ